MNVGIRSKGYNSFKDHDLLIELFGKTYHRTNRERLLISSYCKVSYGNSEVGEKAFSGDFKIP